MQLTFQSYKDKVKACWLGKNIGGTLGAPFEGYRGVYDVSYYTHDLSTGVLPNDDLDLQLIWLNAAEQYGKNVNADILGEYWLSYIVGDWSEYGAGKNNMRYGLRPPVSGWFQNCNRYSNGCFIRSEIWACLAPGHPDIAVRYAYEDAICDHAEEGMHGAIFCAALQSAAFVEKDRDVLLKTALSYIPEDSDIAKVVHTVRECYESGMDWKQARKLVMQQFPTTFGIQHGYRDQEPEADIPIGAVGYDAPCNIGFMMIGWFYGEGDFSKSLCITVGCGEDPDCSAGTLGSILGILGGTAIIEDRWLVPIGDEIKTVSIDRTKTCLNIPETVTELTERVIALMPVFMHGHTSLRNDGQLIFNPVDHMEPVKTRVGMLDWETFADEIATSPASVRKSCPLYDIRVTYSDNDLKIEEGKQKRFHVKVTNRMYSQQWLEFTLHLPAGWSAQPGCMMSVNIDQTQFGFAVKEFDVVITPHDLFLGRYDLLMEIKSNGRMTKTFLELPLFV